MIKYYFLGERYVYKFVCDPEALFNMAYGSSGSGSGAVATVVDPAGNVRAPHHHISDSHIIEEGNNGCRGDTSPTTSHPEVVLAASGGMSPVHRHHHQHHQLYYNQHHYQQLN